MTATTANNITLSKSLQNYILVTAAYWGLTITDGALRMLVLLYFDQLGYTPLQIAFLFLFYEIFGVITNFLGGWIGSELGLKLTLYGGIGLQVFALAMTSLVTPAWPHLLQVVYVMTAQALSGIAKDLTKMSSKSAIKLLIPEEQQSTLFQWVSILTGSKNALKGLGFFVGSVLLAWLGFINALIAMAGWLFLIMLTGFFLPRRMGKFESKIKLTQLFSDSQEINILSAARFFLFGARDVWFVVGLPVFLYSTLGWRFEQVGGFLASWVIGYGIIQSQAPNLLSILGSNQPPQAKTIQIWTFSLAGIPAAIALALQLGAPPATVIIIGLTIFGIVFAFNSAIHSYMVLAFSENEKVVRNVGFYYMANSGGRLAGTVLSGLIFQLFGLPGCLWVATIFVIAAAIISIWIPDPQKVVVWKAGDE
jgi:hypothetical protein